jgi:uncharacterized glyoxalase superfamily protein PhnB
LIGAAARPEIADRSQRRPVVGVELALEVDDLEADRARVAAAGWPIEEGVSDPPVGLGDFRVSDPSGYYWRMTNGGN